jgi:asparagine synthase (glutamine-hydrolysing)
MAMGEIFVKNNNLIGEAQWKAIISSIQTDFNELETNKERAKRKLEASLTEAIKKRSAHICSFGILFSGGIDSALIAFICKSLNKNFTCYTVGLENSKDMEAARAIASYYNLNFKCKILSLGELEHTIKKVIRILGEADVMKVSVGTVLYAASKLALKDNTCALFTGLGSEEIFAGYQRHEEALKKNGFEGLHRECWHGLKEMWQRDLKRDFLLARHLNIKLLTPFLDIGLIKTAMSIHPMYKISKTGKKIILREAAEELGLKKEFCMRQKKAAQYGSNFIGGMDKLARQHNFRLKKEYLQSLLFS